MFRTRIFRAKGRGPRAEGWQCGVERTLGATPSNPPAPQFARPLDSRPSALGPRPSEKGFTLAGLLVILTIIVVFVAYTVPKQWSAVMARERDQQTLFAMKQYARGIRAFQEKNKSLPVSLDQLKEARQPRLMRGKGELIDPLTGKVDWVVVPASSIQAQAQPGQQLPPGVAPLGGSPGTTDPRGGLVVGYAGGTPLPASGAGPVPGSGAAQQPAPGSPGGTVGPIAGVRPNKSGTSYLMVKGTDSYDQWIYTTADLENEIAAARNALMVK